MMATSSYKISVIIATYNCAQYLCRAIDSVLAQTYPAHEIIVVDDGSTDNTAKILKGYGDGIRHLYQENAGANIARNVGIRLSTGNWVAFLDADDEWFPYKLERQIDLLKKFSDLVWAYANYEVQIIDKNRTYLCHKRQNIESLLNEKGFFGCFLDAYAAHIPVQTSSMIIRRDVLLEVGMFLPGQLIHHDSDLALRISYRYPEVGYIRHPLAINHFGRKDSITQQSKLAIKERCDFISEHLELSLKYGHQAKFQMCASVLLRKWMKEIQISHPGTDISDMLKRFNDLIPFGLKAEMYLRMKCPKAAPFLIRIYFKTKSFIRRFK